MRGQPVTSIDPPAAEDEVAVFSRLQATDAYRDDLNLRARLKALEMIVGQLVAEQLGLSGAPVATANSALRDLIGSVTALPLPDLPRDERARFRDLAKYAVYDILEHAVAAVSGPARPDATSASAIDKATPAAVEVTRADRE
jgi:hypothetical protein